MEKQQTSNDTKIDLSNFDMVELRTIMDNIIAGGHAVAQMRDTVVQMQRTKEINLPAMKFNDIVKQCNIKIEHNNRAIRKIEFELKKRVKELFPHISVFTDIDKFSGKIDEEIQKHGGTKPLDQKGLMKMVPKGEA